MKLKSTLGLIAMCLVGLVVPGPEEEREGTAYPDADLVQGAIGALVLVLIVGTVVIPTVSPLGNDIQQANETWQARGLGGPNPIAPCQNATGSDLAFTPASINRVFNNTQAFSATNGTDWSYFSNNNTLKCVDGGNIFRNTTLSVDYQHSDPSKLGGQAGNVFANVPTLLAVLVIVAVASLVLYAIKR